MKTLGQIAHTAGWPEDAPFAKWDNPDNAVCKRWEAAAQAVRAAVIEECAKVCESMQKVEPGEVGPSMWPFPEHCAQAIRSLK